MLRRKNAQIFGFLIESANADRMDWPVNMPDKYVYIYEIHKLMAASQQLLLTWMSAGFDLRLRLD